ncbi:zinc-ribbon domain-containing protein [Adlercreutzia sp. ZJ138]
MKKVWWKDKCGHVYEMTVKNRVKARPDYCPYYSGRKKPERPIKLN